jgi:hypothetical protein
VCYDDGRRAVCPAEVHPTHAGSDSSLPEFDYTTAILANIRFILQSRIVLVQLALGVPSQRSRLENVSH